MGYDNSTQWGNAPDGDEETVALDMEEIYGASTVRVQETEAESVHAPEFVQQQYVQQYDVQQYEEQYLEQYEQASQGEYIEEEDYGRITVVRRVLNPSTILSIIAATLILIGMNRPIFDFSVFHKNINIQYNIFKVCKNVRVLSAIWNGIPYVMIAGVILLYLLSFVNIPPLKIMPCVIITIALVIALNDISNVVKWANELIEKYVGKNQVSVSKGSIHEGIMDGAYYIAAGVILGLISSFIPGAKPKKKSK